MPAGIQQALAGYSFKEGAPQNQSGGVNVSLQADGTGTVTTGTPASPANWFSIAPQPGIGFNYWFFVVSKVSSTGSATTVANIGVAQNLSSPPAAPIVSGLGSVLYNYKITSDQAGSNTVASGTMTTNNTI